MSGQLRSHSVNYTLTSKNLLTIEEMEFYELAELGGIRLDPNVFKIILDLLKMNVTPTAVLQMLKSMCGGRKKRRLTSDQVHASETVTSHQKTASKSRQVSSSRRTEVKR